MIFPMILTPHLQVLHLLISSFLTFFSYLYGGNKYMCPPRESPTPAVQLWEEPSLNPGAPPRLIFMVLISKVLSFFC